MTEDFRGNADVAAPDSFSPEGTVPNVGFETADSSGGVAEVDNFYTSPYIAQDQMAVGFEAEPESSSNGQEVVSSDAAFTPAPAAVASSKRSGGKVFAIVGGLFALFVLGIAALGGGLYYYANYYAVAPEPEATPVPSIEPTPEPTTDFAANSDNSNTDSSNSSANGTDDLTVAPTPEPGPASTPEQTVTTKQTPQTTGKKPTGTTPTSKEPKPKPTSTRDRKIILQ
jgi:hypothetical protein